MGERLYKLSLFLRGMDVYDIDHMDRKTVKLFYRLREEIVG